MKPQMVEQISSAFEEMSQRNTRPRQLLQERLVALSQTGETFSLDELWQSLRSGDGQIGRATVFRTVEWLVQSDVVDRIEFADGSRRYRVCGGTHHHHLACTQCHRVVEIEACLPQNTLDEIGTKNDFVIEGHALTLFGTCGQCQQN